MISVVALFTDSFGGFLNALTPTVSITLVDGSVISSGSATFVSNGIYQYSFNYNYDTQYIWQFDGGNTLNDTERYVTGSFMIPSASTSQGAITSQFIRNAMLLSPKGVVQTGSIDDQFTFYKRILYIVDRIAKFLKIIY